MVRTDCNSHVSLTKQRGRQYTVDTAVAPQLWSGNGKGEGEKHGFGERQAIP